MANSNERVEPRRPPTPPPELLAGVGSGDYFEIGERALALLEEHAGLRDTDRILDVGCGLGRLAWPLGDRLAGSGSYDGFDVARPYVNWCSGSLGLDPARFRFHHADVRTRLYNPQGKIEPADFRFPWPDRSFDLAIATSLFTHLLPDAAPRYLREIARTLDRGGRLFASFFLLDERARKALAGGTALQPLTSAVPDGLVADPDVPENAVGYDADWLLREIAGAGLEVRASHAGYWKGQPGLEYQDLVVARRR
ncbi:MAG TPA: class I SAM-dependent methyltransferase [Thermoanaerobaculia bacterium]|nr:class I SAM-dependent methyltransferase [Thermoanaerobaculia bacterium]